ncbi:MAG: hypothetical protein K2I16_11970 [Muribaculaceae bacterium]|nr:hypothetical protein [Muribaculaceae bacterium]
MNKLSIFTIPAEVLSEMEALQIQGGAGSEGEGNTFVLASCVLNGAGAYCGNCVAQCACDDTGDQGADGGSSDKP